MVTLPAAEKPPYKVCVEVGTTKGLLVLHFNQQPLTLSSTALEMVLVREKAHLRSVGIQYRYSRTNPSHRTAFLFI